MQEPMEWPVLRRCRSISSENEASAGPLLTYRPKPSFGTETTFAKSSSSSFASSNGFGSRCGLFSSGPPSKTSEQSSLSSPLSSAGGKSSSSSPSMSWSSPKGPGSASAARPAGLYSMSMQSDGDASDKPGDVERACSWSQYLNGSGEVHEETAEKRHTVNEEELFVGQKFACGTYSRLYRGQYKQQEVAIKLVTQPDDDEEIANRLDRQFVQEVSLLSRLHHHNIVEFVGAMRKPPVFCIITEFLEGGSLRTFLNKNLPQRLPIDLISALALDIARGMDYLHSQGVLHLDLKSPNLVLSENWRVKITDFGVARLQSECESMTPDSGTYRWMAPEMINNKTFSTKADVYSFGIILWELVSGQTPYEDMSTIQAAFAVVDKNMRPDIPDYCLPPLKQLMEECWSAHPDKRPHFWQIVERLEKFQECVREHVSFQSQFKCEKQSWFGLLLGRMKVQCV